VRVDVILPAGGRIEGPLAEEAETDVKALIRFDGRSLLETAAESAKATGVVNRTVVIGPQSIRRIGDNCADAVLPEAESGPANIFNGFRWLGEQPGAAEHVLILTTDLPFLLPHSVSQFLESCPPNADICLPLFSRQEFESRFPGSQNTYVKLRDGQWTAGCAYLLRRHALEQNRGHIDRLFEARKSAFAMARLLGPFFIARYVTKTLRVPHLESHCAKMTGCTAAAIRGCDPALAFDIDDLQDYHYALSTYSSLTTDHRPPTTDDRSHFTRNTQHESESVIRHPSSVDSAR